MNFPILLLQTAVFSVHDVSRSTDSTGLRSGTCNGGTRLDCQETAVMESHLSNDQSMTYDRENTAIYSRPDNHQFYSLGSVSTPGLFLP